MIWYMIYGLNWMFMQNGTSEEVKNLVSALNAGEVPSQDVVGKWMKNESYSWNQIWCGA